jgi:hypothetical protein
MAELVNQCPRCGSSGLEDRPDSTELSCCRVCQGRGYEFTPEGGELRSFVLAMLTDPSVKCTLRAFIKETMAGIGESGT